MSTRKFAEANPQELAASLTRLPRGSVQVGFYSYGEIAVHLTKGAQLHNQSMTLTTFRRE